MAVKLPNGVILSLATAYGASRTVTTVTNANPAVATTSTAHGVTNGAFVEVISGWNEINNSIQRAAGASGSTLSYEGVNATNTTLYPAGSGGGSIREITTWTQIQQIIGSTSSGGEMQFTNYSFLEQNFESQLPTQASAQSIAIQIADDPTLPGYIALRNASRSRAITAMRAALPDGSVILYNGYVSLNETPTFNKGEIMTVTATFSLQGLPVRYAS